MIAFDSRFFRRVAVAEPLVGKHGFADVDSPVVNQVDGDHVVPDPCQEFADGHPESIVADVSEMLGLVRIRGGIFHHDAAPCSFRQGCLCKNMLHGSGGVTEKRFRIQHHVDERFDLDRVFDIGICFQQFDDFFGNGIGAGFEDSCETETVYGNVALHSFGALFRGDCPAVRNLSGRKSFGKFGTQCVNGFDLHI